MLCGHTINVRGDIRGGLYSERIHVKGERGVEGAQWSRRSLVNVNGRTAGACALPIAVARAQVAGVSQAAAPLGDRPHRRGRGWVLCHSLRHSPLQGLATVGNPFPGCRSQ